MLALGVVSCSPQGGGEAVSVNLPEQLEQGKNLYEQACAQCHYDGSGNPAAPDLRGSAVLAQPPEALARIILAGRRGESLKDGKKLAAIMPPQAYLRDDEIAAIVVYVRAEFGGRPEGFPPEAVGVVRAGVP